VAKEYRLLLSLPIIGIGFYFFSEQWLLVLGFSLFHIFQLYRGSALFHKHWESPTRHFIQTQKDLSPSKSNWTLSVFFVLLGLLFTFLENTFELPADTFSIIQFVLFLTGVMSFISAFIKKAPSIEISIKSDKLSVFRNQALLLSTYFVTDFEVNTHVLKIEEHGKKILEIDELVITPEQLLLLSEQLDRLKNRTNQELTQRKKGWLSLGSWSRRRVKRDER